MLQLIQNKNNNVKIPGLIIVILANRRVLTKCVLRTLHLHLTLPTNLRDTSIYMLLLSSPFTDEKTDTEKASHLHKGTQPANGANRAQAYVVWLQTPC